MSELLQVERFPTSALGRWAPPPQRHVAPLLAAPGYAPPDHDDHDDQDEQKDARGASDEQNQYPFPKSARPHFDFPSDYTLQNHADLDTEAYQLAEQAFTEYFVRNYPGPDTIIFDPKWHAPKLFAAVTRVWTPDRLHRARRGVVTVCLAPEALMAVFNIQAGDQDYHSA